MDQLDLECHRRLRDGDRVAFEQLYRRYAPGAYGLALRVTGQELLAQDVVHEAFLALWRGPEALDPTRGAVPSLFLSPVPHPPLDTGPPQGPLRRPAAP